MHYFSICLDSESVSSSTLSCLSEYTLEGSDASGCWSDAYVTRIYWAKSEASYSSWLNCSQSWMDNRTIVRTRASARELRVPLAVDRLMQSLKIFLCENRLGSKYQEYQPWLIKTLPALSIAADRSIVGSMIPSNYASRHQQIRFAKFLSIMAGWYFNCYLSDFHTAKFSKNECSTKIFFGMIIIISIFDKKKIK